MNSQPALTADTLRDKTILLTGASGFVGKLVLEKLLRVVGGKGQIFLLMRGNRKFPSASLRLTDEVLRSSLFDRLRAEKGDSFEADCVSRLHCLEGHLTQPRFGLTEDEFEETALELDLIINAAASVDFREPLDQALETNTLALDSLISFARRTPHCPLVHVSTCYVHGYHTGYCEESNVIAMFGDPPVTQYGYVDSDAVVSDLQEKIAAVRAQHDDKDDLISAMIELGIETANKWGWNDTYTFTKWLGEQRLLNAMQGHTLTILRPSIIESVLRDPTPGWIEGVKVADAVIMAYAREHVMLFPGRPSLALDIIPVDWVANSILITSAEALEGACRHRFYQCGSSAENPLTLKQLIDMVRTAAAASHMQLDRLFPKKPERSFIMIPGKLFRTLTAGALAFQRTNYRVRKSLGRSTSRRTLMRLETTVRLALVFSFYTTQRYVFDNSELLGLSSRLAPEDRELFPVSAAEIDWQHYLGDVHLTGLNDYALKPSKAKAAKAAAASA